MTHDLSKKSNNEMLNTPKEWLKGNAGVDEMKVWLETYFLPENNDEHEGIE